MPPEQKYEPNIALRVIARTISSFFGLVLLLFLIFSIREILIYGSAAAITVTTRTLYFGAFVFVSLVAAVIAISLTRRKFLIFGFLAGLLYFLLAFSSILRISRDINLTQNIGFRPVFLNGEITNFGFFFFSVDQILIAALILMAIHIRISPLFTNDEMR